MDGGFEVNREGKTLKLIPGAYTNTCLSTRMKTETITQALNWVVTQKMHHTIITNSQNLLRNVEHNAIRNKELRNRKSKTSHRYAVPVMPKMK